MYLAMQCCDNRFCCYSRTRRRVTANMIVSSLIVLVTLDLIQVASPVFDYVGMWLGVLPLCDHFNPSPGVSPLFNPFLFSPVASPAPCVLRLYGRRVKFNCLAGDVRHTNEVSLSCGSGCTVVWSKLPSHVRARGFPLLWVMLTGRVVDVSLLFGRGCPFVLSRFPCRVAEAVRSWC